MEFEMLGRKLVAAASFVMFVSGRGLRADGGV